MGRRLSEITGDVGVDLRSNIAAEARAKIVYERLISFTEDLGSKQALQFLMTREITHMRAFSAALESMEKPAFSVGLSTGGAPGRCELRVLPGDQGFA